MTLGKTLKIFISNLKLHESICDVIFNSQAINVFDISIK